MGNDNSQYLLRMTQEQKDRLESLASESGFTSIRDFILHCIFNRIETSNLGQNEPDPDGNIKYILESFAKYLQDFEQTIARILQETIKENKAMFFQIDNLLQGNFTNSGLMLILFTNFIRQIYCEDDDQREKFLRVLEVSKKETFESMKKRGLLKGE